jgi:poly(3-hydroxybutyrate) depolymerase
MNFLRSYRGKIMLGIIVAVLLLSIAFMRTAKKDELQIVKPTKSREVELAEQLLPKKQIELTETLQKLTIGGIEREYIAVKPKNETPKKLLIALHGGSGSAKLFSNSLNISQEIIADTVVLYPNSTDGNWKDERFQDTAATANDVEFISTIIKDTQKAYTISPEKTALLGVSNGGFMSQSFVCKDAGLIHSTVLISAPILSELAESCGQLSQHVSLILGTNDTITPYKGGEIQSPQGGEVLSGEKSTEFLAKKMKCTEENIEKEEKDQIVQTYPACANAGSLTVISKVGETHISTLLRTKIDNTILKL